MKEYITSVFQTFKINWDEKNISAPFIMLFLLGVYYIYRSKEKDIKEIFVYPLVFYGLTIFNPFVHWILIKKMGFAGRSHRFFWILPMVFVLSWLAVEATCRISDIRKRCLLWFVLVSGCFLAGRPMTLEEHYRTENIYKVTDEVLDISEKLEELEGENEKRVFFNESHINYIIRQYDPSICLLINPHQFEKLTGIEEDVYLSNPENFTDLEKLIFYFCNHFSEISYEFVENELREAEIEYLILNYEEKLLQENQKIQKIDTCGRFYIYKVL